MKGDLSMRLRFLLPVIMTGLLLLTGCAPAEIQQEANQYVSEYNDAFLEKAKTAYGENIDLRNVTGIIEKTTDPETHASVYQATGDLKGAVVTNKTMYNVIYHPDTNTIDSTAYTKDIEQAFLDNLPFDQEQILYYKMANKLGGTPLFDSSVSTVESAALSKCEMYLYIITTEDLSTYDYTAIQNISLLQQIANGNATCKITVVSVTDTEQLTSLKESIRDYDFSSDNIPMTKHLKQAENLFHYYHINNSLYISFQNTNIKCNFLTI